MTDESLAVEVVAAGATTAAVLVALWTSHRALQLQRRGLRAEGRREAAFDISCWLQSAERGILAWHDPDSWRVPDGMKFGPETNPARGRRPPEPRTNGTLGRGNNRAVRFDPWARSSCFRTYGRSDRSCR